MNYVMRDGRRIEIETVETGVPSKKKKVDPFAKIPLATAGKMFEEIGSAGAMVVVMLLYLAWKAGGKPFPFSNERLARYGVSRQTKYRVLTELEAAGLIRQQRSGSGKSPTVTVL
jgi:hypothetical protein